MAINDLRPLMLGLTITTGTLAFSATMMRLFVCLRVHKSFKADDYFSFAAESMSLLGMILICLMSDYGLGKHVSQVQPWKFDTLAKYDVFGPSCYPLSAMFIQISLCIFYLRLSAGRIYQRIIYVMLCLITIFGIIDTIVGIFPCAPFKKVYEPQTPGRCINRVYLQMFAGVWSFTTDAILFSLPLSLVWKLKVANNKRNRLFLLFGIALIAIAASIAQIGFIAARLKPNADADFSYTVVPAILASYMNAGTTIIVASAPAFQSLLLRYWPGLLEPKQTELGPHAFAYIRQPKPAAGTQGPVDRFVQGFLGSLSFTRRTNQESMPAPTISNRSRDTQDTPSLDIENGIEISNVSINKSR